MVVSLCNTSGEYICFNLAVILGNKLSGIVRADVVTQVGYSLVDERITIGCKGHLAGIDGSAVSQLKHHLATTDRGNFLDFNLVACLGVDCLSALRHLVLASRSELLVGGVLAEGIVNLIVKHSHRDAVLKATDILTALTHSGLHIGHNVGDSTLDNLVALNRLQKLFLCLGQLLSVVLRH